MQDTFFAILGWLAPIISTIIITAATVSINAQAKKHERAAEERHQETEKKRKAEAEWRNCVERQISEQAEALKHVADDRVDWYSWREEVVRLMNTQDRKIMSMLKSQVTQMRSDGLHKAHRYIDDLGCASTEEKDAFWAEYKEYCSLCKQYGIENSFVDELAKQVMSLPTREIASKKDD